jgi:HCNGP-like protein
MIFFFCCLFQQKINRFLAYRRVGRSFNAEVRNRKDYKNPDFLQHAVRYQDIDQIGTCFSKEVFDPHGFDKSDYYDVIGSIDSS